MKQQKFAKHSKKKKYFIIFLTPFMIIFLCEIFLRVTSGHKFIYWTSKGFVPDRILGYKYLPDTTFIYTNIAFTNTHQTNSHGFPGANFEKNKKNDVYRILVVGLSDETSFYSDGPVSYVQMVREMFEKENYPVEIINCSVEGGVEDMCHVDFIRNECIKYNPDLILHTNLLPLESRFRYRETYKGYALVASNLAHIASYKRYIDGPFADKVKNNLLFKLYRSSYIFRYYMKIYFDAYKDKKRLNFAEFSNHVFGFYNLNDLQLYARKEMWIPSHTLKEYDIWMYDLNDDIKEVKGTWKDYLYSDRTIRFFTSGEHDNAWLEIDMTNYLKGKITDNAPYIHLLFLCRPSETRKITFVSNNISLSEKDTRPVLYINGLKANMILHPVESGTLKTDGASFELSDSLITVYNHLHEVSYGLLQFDVSNIDKIEKAILNLYVTDIAFGTGIEDNQKEYTLSESVDILDSLHTFLEKRNIGYMIYDTYSHPLSSRYKKSFANRQMNYFSLEVPRREEYSFGKLDGHSTQAGHQAMAEALFEKLTMGIIPKPYMQKASNKE